MLESGGSRFTLQTNAGLLALKHQSLHSVFINAGGYCFSEPPPLQRPNIRG